MYDELIPEDIDALTEQPNNDSRKYISQTLSTMQVQYLLALIYITKTCLKKVFERSIAERNKLRKRRINEIKRKKQSVNNKLFKEYFTNFQSPSDMYKKLGET